MKSIENIMKDEKWNVKILNAYKAHVIFIKLHSLKKSKWNFYFLFYSYPVPSQCLDYSTRSVQRPSHRLARLWGFVEQEWRSAPFECIFDSKSNVPLQDLVSPKLTTFWKDTSNFEICINIDVSNFSYPVKPFLVILGVILILNYPILTVFFQ